MPPPLAAASDCLRPEPHHDARRSAPSGPPPLPPPRRPRPPLHPRLGNLGGRGRCAVVLMLRLRWWPDATHARCPFSAGTVRGIKHAGICRIVQEAARGLYRGSVVRSIGAGPVDAPLRASCSLWSGCDPGDRAAGGRTRRTVDRRSALAWLGIVCEHRGRRGGAGKLTLLSTESTHSLTPPRCGRVLRQIPSWIRRMFDLCRTTITSRPDPACQEPVRKTMINDCQTP